MRTTLLALATLAIAVSGCGDRGKACPPTPIVANLTGDVVASVNGVPITEADLKAAGRGGHGGEPATAPTPDERKAILETVIRDELIAQRAVELGLAADPAYQEQLHLLQAQVDTFRRQRLADLYHARELAEVKVTDEEARRYFDDHAARLQTEAHVWQILVRDEARIEEVRRELEAGAAFEEVAARILPQAPGAESRPWDLGYLRWNQTPEPWQPELARLEKGQTSGVIRGPKNRFWIIRLIDRRTSPDVTFESTRATIVDTLKGQRIAARRDEENRALRGKAQIVYR